MIKLNKKVDFEDLGNKCNSMLLVDKDTFTSTTDKDKLIKGIKIRDYDLSLNDGTLRVFIRDSSVDVEYNVSPDTAYVDVRVIDKVLLISQLHNQEFSYAIYTSSPSMMTEVINYFMGLRG